MRVLVTGGLGFVGRHLSQALLASGHQVTAIGLQPRPVRIDHPDFRYLSADTSVTGPWQAEVQRAAVVVNLAGKTIFKRWSAAYKQQIVNSRVKTTSNLVAAIERGKVLLSTSAMGYYGHRNDDLLDEDQPPGNDFLARVSRQWEAAALASADKGVRVAVMRFGIVMGAGGGAMQKMLPVFRFFMGGPLGKGRQWVPWIHMSDLVNAIGYLLTHDDLGGVYNLCSPNPARSRDLAAALGRVLKRPAKMAAPSFMLRVMMGEVADVMMASQRAVPRRLMEAGFDFKFPQLENALRDILEISP